MKQNSIDWFYEQVIDLIGSTPQVDSAFEQAKAMQKKEVKNVTKSWVQRREQTRVISEHYGFVVGFEKGLDCYEDYYQELDKTDLDEEEFTKEYINNIFEETFNNK